MIVCVCLFWSLAGFASAPGEMGKNEQDTTIKYYSERVLAAAGDSAVLLQESFAYGEYLDEQGDVEGAIVQLKTALACAQQIQNNERVAAVANYLASVYWMTGDFESSTVLYQLALDHADKTHEAGLIAKVSMNLASNYNYLGDYESAIQYSLKALDIKEKAGNVERICYHYVSTGNVFKEINNIDKWLEYTMKAYRLKGRPECASVSDIAAIYNSLGGIAEQRSQYNEALAYYDTLRIISDTAEYRQGLSVAFTNSALVYEQLGNPRKALQLITKAEAYFGPNPYDLIFNYNCKGALYQVLGDEKRALYYAEANIQNENIQYYSAEKIKCLRLLYTLNRSLGYHEAAYRWSDSLRLFESNQRDEEVRKAVEEMDTRFQTEKKEQQIALLTTENRLKKRSIALFIAVTIALALAIGMGILDFIRRKRHHAIRQEALQQKLLRLQMNPHFLFNALGSIQNFIYKNEVSRAAGYLNNFASLTRAILENSTQEMVPLSDEIETLRNYLVLEQMRGQDSFEFKIVASDEMDSEFIFIPPMFIQPFVENAIKHGLHNIEYYGELMVKFVETQNMLTIEIMDNGKGFDTARRPHHEGHRSMAMKIFEERCRLMTKQLKKTVHYTVVNRHEINSEETGTLVTIKLPI